jgi:hypothetical protein
VKATPIQQTIGLLEQEIEALEQRRGELLRVIDSLRPLAGEVRARPTGRKQRTNERTNERTSKARANGTPAEPP